MALAPRSTKRQAVEAAVLRATEELLRDGSSFADLNVERIATRAGIKRTAFYFYFRDKRELLMRLTAEVSEELYGVAASWFAGDDEQLAAALRQIGELYREHAALLRAVVEVSTYDEEVATFWRGLVGRFVDAPKKRLRRAGPRGPGRGRRRRAAYAGDRSHGPGGAGRARRRGGPARRPGLPRQGAG